MRTLGNKIIRYETVTSTNQVLKDLIGEGVGNGAVVTAKVQTAGRGRLDRSWESPEGGLWMSVLLELGDSFDTNRLGLISLMAGSTVATAILMEFGVDAGVKWPNDVMISGRKVCGILAEMHIFQDKKYVILGIGINANNKMADTYDFSDSSTSIAEEFGKKIEMSVLENTILEELDFRMELLKNAEFDKILDDWRELSVTLGKRVNVVTPNGELRGMAKDIDVDGSLLIDLDGRVEKIMVGDCRHLD